MSIRDYLVAALITASSVSYGQVNNSRIDVNIGEGTTYNLTQKRAERQLKTLAKTSVLEDAWVYYDNKLIDVGINESPEGVDICMDEYLNKDVTVYHIHPLHDVIHPPSVTDMLFEHAANKYSKITTKMIDGRGVWEYNIKEPLAKDLDKLFYTERKEYMKSKLKDYVFKNIEDHIRTMDTLGVNITYKGDVSNNVEVRKGYGSVYNLTQKQAERQLKKLAKTSDIEDAWMYYNNQLIDIGTDETNENVTIHIDKNMQIDSGKTVTFYHIHPNTKLSPPSITDVVNSPRAYEKFKNNKVVTKVFDEKNIWEYDITEKLARDLCEMSTYEQLFYLQSKINIAYDPDNKYLVLGMQPYPYTPTKIKEHIKIMNDIGVIVKYSP